MSLVEQRSLNIDFEPIPFMVVDNRLALVVVYLSGDQGSRPHIDHDIYNLLTNGKFEKLFFTHV